MCCHGLLSGDGLAHCGQRSAPASSNHFRASHCRRSASFRKVGGLSFAGVAAASLGGVDGATLALAFVMVRTPACSALAGASAALSFDGSLAGGWVAVLVAGAGA